MYKVEFSEEAVTGAALLKKSSVPAYKKLAKLIVELQEHPTTGTDRKSTRLNSSDVAIPP